MSATREGDEGPAGLMPPWGWSRDRLRRGNYIDAMAMIRRSVIQRVGGYTLDHRLYGWEDYELWLRILRDGGHGKLVRNVLGRYFVGRASMISTTNVDHSEALALLRTLASA